MNVHQYKADFQAIVTEAHARHAPSSSVPIAVERFLVREYGNRPMPITPYGDPTDEWWDQLAKALLLALVPTVERFDPTSTLNVGLKIDKETKEQFLTIFVTPNHNPLTMRTYDLRWSIADQELRLTPVSQWAWFEMWRSLYAPDAIETD
ncbi:MAG: hypothetical protein HOW73_45430 [Polyangiaceae bacterium]|nr:hypothetical protein [Polyangiaceae bacterium]